MSWLRGWWELVAVLALGAAVYATGSWLPLIPLFSLWVFATARTRRRA